MQLVSINVLLVLQLFVLLVKGNTEIVNFNRHGVSSLNSTPTSSHRVVSSSPGETLQIYPLGLEFPPDCNTRLCPQEAWLELDLSTDQWNFDMFTIRLSWAAFEPTDVSINLFKTTNPVQVYAQIIATHAGVLTPSEEDPSKGSNLAPVSFVIKVEPLYLGVIPATIVPTLSFLAPLLFAVHRFVLPVVVTALFTSASDARKDIVARRNAAKRR